MPIAMDPNARFAVELDGDVSRFPDPTTRPRLWYRHLTHREWHGVLDAYDELVRDSEVADRRQAWQRIMQAATAGLVDWENMRDAEGQPIPFDPERLDAILTDAEIGELLGKVRDARDVGPAEKKVSESPSPGDTEKSADAAPATSPAATD